MADDLTPREVEVTRYLVRGWRNKDIAAALGVSTKTVEAHKSRVYAKLGLHGLRELIARYGHAGPLTPPE